MIFTIKITHLQTKQTIVENQFHNNQVQEVEKKVKQLFNTQQIQENIDQTTPVFAFTVELEQTDKNTNIATIGISQDQFNNNSINDILDFIENQNPFYSILYSKEVSKILINSIDTIYTEV